MIAHKQTPPPLNFESGVYKFIANTKTSLIMNKVNIFKNIWLKIPRSRTNIDRPGETAPSDQSENKHGPPPPEYTDLPVQDNKRDATPKRETLYPIMTRFAKESREIRDGQLIWSLVEIIAVTFSTDCRRLTAALEKNDPSWASIAGMEDSPSMTNETGRILLKEISALVRSFQKEMSRNRWLLIPKREKDLIEKIVLEPVIDFNLNLDYVLELLGRYDRVEGCPRPESTLVDCWLSRSPKLGDTIASHALIIRNVPLGENVHHVLEDSIIRFQKENGLEGLCTSTELQKESMLSVATMCCWPLSDEYMDLAQGLRVMERDGVMNDPFELSRARLREARDFRKNWE
ncbi:hypothetical protein BU24DRAFT_423358 [Aaosphaeria arxii CBS 175.79]|uniref:Uncharacterized protein n=1 Tax=Aaosphaeria arxii CBS 175.79 TaxID=1450172 RepID=A0A6A5XMN5_9PLEO|nr:uncharacterized protein BU24DRAFT_423358 [Aaosphaeria arxii CBS 175.79]KAF2014402.1 hypothetical protein BU24DRAFT_423358 [Aaosphaeria arxii CBS 175.79]